MFKDTILQRLIKKYPKPHFEDRSEFFMRELIKSVISQQLLVKASDTIFSRFVALFSNGKFPTATTILGMNDEEMRHAGLSYAKVTYVKSIANAFMSDLIDIGKMRKQSDEEVIAELTQIKGIGKWTAEMILIFTLNRPDVFSIGDLGLRRAIENLYGITDNHEMIKLSETWRPYRSTACWYLWRSLENKNKSV
ncbi:MAG TPA: DNA-3-methyladenine glycosylase [Candidatus Sulfotelmatobacter sp.]|jgi:DNA-3-methyladenine glycosylase II|nr:DNA-3-methyladenine glycosylase [Candidatus Sulfotelmatobacter sp.]